MEFTFEHSASFILPLVHKVTGHIKEQVCDEQKGLEQLLNKCKFIITEFCTNAIKHSGQQQSGLNIYTANQHLFIERTDEGRPFSVKWKGSVLSFPLPEEVNVITLMEDDINCLRLKKINPNTAKFYTEQKAADHINSRHINEHFGLIIICTLCDEFVYTHNPANGSNIFTAKLKLL